ncbi:hypothetical protein [Microbacterium sp. cf332]|uniref:hypothetical protein n=1 Tax=Microbacterium sp. cf332 TaxID=1761804 RepID=UPI00088A95E1|nr:hypothetical protein [Microbacterium sp. cf332]SDQ11943.1 hypothetical protein SAMN04487847_0450 [Microbacterium sp. cf332]
MPRAYGFRVFIVEAFKNRKKDQPPLDSSSSSNVRSEIVELLERLADRNTLRFPPREPVDGEPAKPTRTATLTGPVEIGSEVIHLELAVGETGSHGYATHAVEPPVNIKDRSAEQPHRITLVFSTVSATRFVVVCQTIHKRDAVRRFFQLLTDEGLRKKQEIQAEQERQREIARAAGERLPSAARVPRLLFDYKQAADNAFLEEILSGAKSASATFTSRVASNRGGAADRVERTLKISLVDENQRQIAPAVGRSWWGRMREGHSVSAHEGVSEVSALLEQEHLLDEDEGDRYDKVSLSIKSEADETTTIAVDTLRDVFTYPVSDGEPSILYYYEKVAGRLHTIAMQDGLHLSRLDPYEVEECLSASIFGH